MTTNTFGLHYTTHTTQLHTKYTMLHSPYNTHCLLCTHITPTHITLTTLALKTCTLSTHTLLALALSHSLLVAHCTKGQRTSIYKP